MEVIMSYEQSKKWGSEELLERLNKFCPELELYKIKTDWEINPKYNTTAKGVFGDIGVKWYHNCQITIRKDGIHD